MSIDDGAIRAIALIDSKIQSLRQQLQAFEEIKQVLLAGGTANNGRGTLTETPFVPPATTHTAPQSRQPGRQPQSRKEEVQELLRRSGPLRRSEIHGQTGIPKGTVSFCLNDQHLFRSLGDGRWDVVKKDSAQ